MMLSCQEHRTMGTPERVGRGIRKGGFAKKLFCLGGVAILLPADSLCKPEATKWKFGSTRTTHHLIPDFWSVPHIVINSCILEQSTSSFK